MLVITYDPNYEGCVPDGRVSEVADTIVSLKDQKYKWIVSNQSVVDELRLRVCKGEINHKDIVFKIGGEDVKVNEYGSCPSGYPKEFCVNSNRVIELLKCAFDKRRKNINAEVLRKEEWLDKVDTLCENLYHTGECTYKYKERDMCRNRRCRLFRPSYEDYLEKIRREQDASH